MENFESITPHRFTLALELGNGPFRAESSITGDMFAPHTRSVFKYDSAADAEYQVVQMTLLSKLSVMVLRPLHMFAIADQDCFYMLTERVIDVKDWFALLYREWEEQLEENLSIEIKKQSWWNYIKERFYRVFRQTVGVLRFLESQTRLIDVNADIYINEDGDVRVFPRRLGEQSDRRLMNTVKEFRLLLIQLVRATTLNRLFVPELVRATTLDRLSVPELHDLFDILMYTPIEGRQYFILDCCYPAWSDRDKSNIIEKLFSLGASTLLRQAIRRCWLRFPAFRSWWELIHPNTFLHNVYQRNMDHYTEPWHILLFARCAIIHCNDYFTLDCVKSRSYVIAALNAVFPSLFSTIGHIMFMSILSLNVTQVEKYLTISIYDVTKRLSMETEL